MNPEEENKNNQVVEEMDNEEKSYEYDDDVEELVEENDIYLHALIELLIEKGIISKEDYENKLAEFESRSEEDESEGLNEHAM